MADRPRRTKRGLPIPPSGGGRKKGMVNLRFGKAGRPVPTSEATYSRAKRENRRLYEDGSLGPSVRRRGGGSQTRRLS